MFMLYEYKYDVSLDHSMYCSVHITTIAYNNAPENAMWASLADPITP